MTQALHQRTHEARSERLGVNLRTELWFIERGSWQRSGWELRSTATLRGRTFTFVQPTPIEPTPNRWRNHRGEAAADILRQERAERGAFQPATQEV